MIRFLVDSTSDYIPAELEGRNVDFVPLNVTLNGKTYKDGIDMTKDEFYEILESDETISPKTALPSPEEFLPYFRAAKENGDELICILISSSLSGTCQSALVAKEIAEYDNIYIVDSKTTTHAIRIMLEYAERLRDQGASAEEIVEKLEDVKSRIKIIAPLDTLEYLCRGGRISRTAAAIGGAMNIKPIITVTEDGEVAVIKKCVGKVKARSYAVNAVKEAKLDKDFPIYSVYAYGTENSEKMEQVLEKEGYQISGRVQVGTTIGAHVGPGTYGIFFVVEKE